MQVLFRCFPRNNSEAKFGGVGLRAALRQRRAEAGGRLLLVSAACGLVCDSLKAWALAAMVHSRCVTLTAFYLHVHILSFHFALLLWVLL